MFFFVSSLPAILSIQAIVWQMSGKCPGNNLQGIIGEGFGIKEELLEAIYIIMCCFFLTFALLGRITNKITQKR